MEHRDTSCPTPFRLPSGVSRCGSRARHEAGGAAVELALTLPIVVALLFGIFDFGRAYYVQQALSGATREGARMAVAARPVTDAQVIAQVKTYLQDANVTATVTVSPSATGAASGTAIQVVATVDYPLNVLPRTLHLKGAATMVKE